MSFHQVTDIGCFHQKGEKKEKADKRPEVGSERGERNPFEYLIFCEPVKLLFFSVLEMLHDLHRGCERI